MIRLLTLAALVLDFCGILFSMFIISKWLRIAKKKVIQPVFVLLAIGFLNLGVWNFFDGRYLLSAAASLFFVITLTLFMLKPLSETWRACQA